MNWFGMFQIVVARLFGRRGSSRMSKLSVIISDNEKQGSDIDSTPNIGALSVTRIKKRIIETMKMITSPRRTKTCLSSDSHISKLLNFFKKIEAKDIAQDTLQTEKELGKIVGDDQKLSYSVEKNPASFTDREKVTDFLNDDKNQNSRSQDKKRIENWFFGMRQDGVNICKVSKNYSFGLSKNLKKIDKLRGSQKTRSSSNITSSQTLLRENNQSAELLVEPETPETPESPADVTAARVSTSDLVVLLEES